MSICRRVGYQDNVCHAFRILQSKCDSTCYRLIQESRTESLVHPRDHCYYLLVTSLLEKFARTQSMVGPKWITCIDWSAFAGTGLGDSIWICFNSETAVASTLILDFPSFSTPLAANVPTIIQNVDGFLRAWKAVLALSGTPAWNKHCGGHEIQFFVGTFSDSTSSVCRAVVAFSSGAKSLALVLVSSNSAGALAAASTSGVLDLFSVTHLFAGWAS